MKAMSKQQLADRAGVSVRTLNSWCRRYQRELQEMGVTPRMKVLPPHVVMYIANKFCIDVEP